MNPAEFIEDPNWANFLPEKPEPARTRLLPAHEDCTPLNAESAQMHLRCGGTLGRMAGYEERPGQLDMLGAIIRAFNAREHLMIEAGTGVGKSLAYLIPAILWAHVNDTTVVVSTATRNLQSQLISSDIPRALKVLGDDAKNFKVALLKGRANYLCLRAVADFFAAGFWTMSTDEQEEMPHFIDWLKNTPDGDLDHYEGLPRTLLTCPGDECSGRRCPFYTRCFVYRARKTAAEADLVIVNHALILSEAAHPGAGLLPPHGRLVLDEAHNLEDIATECLSCEFSVPILTRLVNRMLRRSKRWSGDIVQRLKPLATVVLGAGKNLADAAEATLLPERKSEQRRYTARQLATGPCLEAQAAFEQALTDLINELRNLRDATEDDDLAIRLDGLAANCTDLANETHFVLSGNKDTHVFWIERVRTPKRSTYVRLVAAPLSVADDLHAMLWDLKDSAILSSATLRVGRDFKYMIRRLGLRDRFQCLTATSPFNYLSQTLVLASDSLPDPSLHPPDYAEALARLLATLFTTTHGRALVLFTSYEMMNAVATEARTRFEKAGLKLLVQGAGLSRESMTRVLKDDLKSSVVLFGAQSFWEGVDVAGEALSCVVMARLPFAQRTDPIVEARGERVKSDGGNAFFDYYLPEAVIKFRQGFGRLIRTKRDHGVVVVTDPRIVSKNYGTIFRQSIPATVHTVTDLDELTRRTGDFLSQFNLNPQ